MKVYVIVGQHMKPEKNPIYIKTCASKDDAKQAVGEMIETIITGLDGYERRDADVGGVEYHDIVNGDEVCVRYYIKEKEEIFMNSHTAKTHWKDQKDGLPPVGTKCICRFYSFGIKTIKATIRAYFEDRVWVDIDETYLDGGVVTRVDAGNGKILVVKETDFGPLPTEEDEAVEAAMKILSSKNWSMEADEIPEIVRDLYRAGWFRHQPENI